MKQRSYFDYLISEYKFYIEEIADYPEAMGNAIVIFRSPTYAIEIVIDRDQVLMRIGEAADTMPDWFEFTNVVRYYAPAVKQVYMFPEKTPAMKWDDVVEIQLQRLAKILRQYCQPLLQGERWKNEEVKKIEAERAAELLRKLGKDTNDQSKSE